MADISNIFSKKSVEIVCQGTILHVPEAFVENLDIYKLQKEFGNTIIFDVDAVTFNKLLCIDMVLRLSDKNVTIHVPLSVQKHAYFLGVKSIIDYLNYRIIEKDSPLYLEIYNLDEMKRVITKDLDPRKNSSKLPHLRSFFKKILMSTSNKQKPKLIECFLRTYFSTRIFDIRKYYDVELMNEEIHFTFKDNEINCNCKQCLIIEYMRNKIYVDVIKNIPDDIETLDSDKIKAPKYVLNNFQPYLLLIFNLNSTNAVDQNGDKCIIFKYQDHLCVKYPSSPPRCISCYKDIFTYNYDKNISRPKFVFLN